MTATPDGISMEKLLALHEVAVNEEPECEPTIDGRPVSEYISSVDDAHDALHKANNHPMTAKKLIMDNLGVLVQWHTDRGLSEIADGDNGAGTAWLRDAGKLQAAMQVVHSVVLPDDFIYSPDVENDNS